MKTLLIIILGSTILLGFSQCKNTKEISYKTVKKTPFKISKATYNEWVAGVKGGGSGVNVILNISNIDTAKTTINYFYFRGQKTTIEIKNSLYIGRFSNSVNQQKELIMSSETSDEYGNQAPVKKEQFPFNLKDNEVIINYKHKGKLYFFKQTLEKEKAVLYQ